MLDQKSARLLVALVPRFACSCRTASGRCGWQQAASPQLWISIHQQPGALKANVPLQQPVSETVACPTRKLQAHCLRCCEVNSLISVVISFSLEAVGCCPVGGGDVVVSAPHARLLTADATNVRLMEAFHVLYLLAKDC